MKTNKMSCVKIRTLATSRTIRNLREEEAMKHFDFLNLCYNGWGPHTLWRRNYSQPGFDLTRDVIVVEDNGEWAGGGTSWFRYLLINEKRVKVYIAGDLYTLPEHRGKKIYLLTMKALNQVAREREAAIGFGFISRKEIPFVALQKIGFVDMWYPTVKIKVLHPEKLLSRIGKVDFPRKFEGISIKLIIAHDGKNIGKQTFLVANGKLQELEESKKADLTIKSDLRTLLNVYNNVGKGRLLPIVIKAILKRKLSLKFSFRFLHTLLK